MAVFTDLSDVDAKRVAEAHGLGEVQRVEGVSAGSVNSNYFLHCDGGVFFVRLYEEQEADGVAYEWALLDAIEREDVPLAKRVRGPGPGELRAAGRPVAVFERAPGEMRCQRSVGAEDLRKLGDALARVHITTLRFGWRRESRFSGDALIARWQTLPDQGPLAAVRERTRERVFEREPSGLPRGPVHGDLFRDNVLWEGDELGALLDWESAADGLLIRDIAVVMLAWCYGDRFETALAGALLEGYEARRPLEDAERLAMNDELARAAARFCVTRTLDYELRRAHLEATGGSIKDYRRFLARLEAVETGALKGLFDRRL